MHDSYFSSNPTYMNPVQMGG